MRFPLSAEKLRHCRSLVEMLESKQADHNAFDALLNASIEAGRSVTFVLEKEIADKCPELRAWYKARTAEMSSPENSALPWLNEARTVTTHDRPVGVGTTTRIGEIKFDKLVLGAGESFEITGRGEPVWTRRDPSGKLVRKHADEFDHTVRSKHFITRPPPPSPSRIDGRDLTGADAVSILREYSRFLEKLLENAELGAAGMGASNSA